MSLKRAFGTAAVAAAFLLCAPRVEAQTAPVTGTVDNKKGDPVGTFTGEFDLEKFVVRKGVLYAVGRLSGTIDLEEGRDRVIKNRRVLMPVDMDLSGIADADVAGLDDGEVEASALDVSILHLVLGPLDLNLLGLEIHLNQVVLDIEADPQGGILGALLAALAGLDLGGVLDFLGDLGDVADLLNAILDLFG